MAIVGTRSLGGRSISKLITGREVFGTVSDTTQWRLLLAPIVDAAGLVGLWARRLYRQDIGAVAITVALLRRWYFHDF